MTLIGILLALIVERVLNHLPGWGRPWLFVRVMNALHAITPTRLWRTPLPALLIVLLPSWAVWWWVEGIEGPVVGLLISAVILLLCLGPRDLSSDVHKLIEAREAGDAERVLRLSRALQRAPHPGHSHHSFAGALFIQSHEKLFGVLLWFFVLGPAGAVAYRLVSRLPRVLHKTAPETWAETSADTLHAVMAWLPARITALVFGLAGSLDAALMAWRKLWRDPEHAWRAQTWAILAEVPLAALGYEETDGSEVVPANIDAMMREVLRMQTRALMVVLAGFVLLTTGSLL